MTTEPLKTKKATDSFARNGFRSIARRLRDALPRGRGGGAYWSREYLLMALAEQLLGDGEPAELPTARRAVRPELRDRAVRFGAWLREELEREEAYRRDGLAWDEWAAAGYLRDTEREAAWRLAGEQAA